MSNPTSSDRYSVQYSLYGDPLDIDALLTQCPPSGDYETWHKGDSVALGRLAKSSGVRIEVVESGRPKEIVEAIDAFLSEEKAFLAEADRFTTDTVYSVLSCALSVYARVPTTIWLPASTLKRMSELGIGWEVTGYPCSEDEP